MSDACVYVTKNCCTALTALYCLADAWVDKVEQGWFRNRLVWVPCQVEEFEPPEGYGGEPISFFIKVPWVRRPKILWILLSKKIGNARICKVSLLRFGISDY